MTMNISLGIRGQFPQGDDMPARLEELLVQVRLARQLGYVAVLKTCHFSSTPFQEIQQLPFLARIAGELGDMSIITGIVLLPLHMPLEIAEQCDSNRIYDNGRRQRIAPAPMRPYLSVDSPEDVGRVEAVIHDDALWGKY